MSSIDYLNTLDKNIVDALTKIIMEENKTSRLIRGNATNEFIEDLSVIIDNYSNHWNKEDGNDL